MHSRDQSSIFESIARGEDTQTSDLDILVDAIDGKTTLISLTRIQLAITELTEIKVDVLTPLVLHERFRNQVLMQATAI